MLRSVLDIPWLDDHDAARARARAEGKPLLVKPLDQGFVEDQHWCPAASRTRATSLSDPRVATFVAQHFVSVRAAFWSAGDNVNLVGREWAIQFATSPLYFQGVIVFDAEGEFVAQTHKDASAADTLATLERALASRPEWAARVEPCDVYDESDAAQRELLAIDRAFPDATPDERATHVPTLRAWLEQHPELEHPGGALARTLLGEALYNAGEFARAERTWEAMLEAYPAHPLRHRTYFHLIDRDTWPVPVHASLAGAKSPEPRHFPAELPFPEQRAANLAAVKSDPRYRLSPSGIPLRWIEPGTFTMGGQPARMANELPLRRVTLTKGFWIAAWPVTRSLWNQHDPRWPGADAGTLEGEVPATRLGHDDADAFLEWLGERDGLAYRMPTEAEWEYAARGGLEGKQYPWGDEPLEPWRANYDRRRPVPVGCYPANGYGLFDVVGNTFEWVADDYAVDAYALTASEVTDPFVPRGTTFDARIRGIRASGCGTPLCATIARLGWRVGFDVSHGATGLRLVVDEL